MKALISLYLLGPEDCPE